MLRIIPALVFAALFATAAFVQRNDPDPWFWIVVYAAGALVSLLFAVRLLPRWLAASVALACLVGAAGILVHFGQTGAAFNPEEQFLAEEVRETGGLVLIGVWALIMAIAGRGRRPDGT